MTRDEWNATRLTILINSDEGEGMGGGGGILVSLRARKMDGFARGRRKKEKRGCAMVGTRRKLEKRDFDSLVD